MANCRPLALAATIVAAAIPLHAAEPSRDAPPAAARSLSDAVLTPPDAARAAWLRCDHNGSCEPEFGESCHNCSDDCGDCCGDGSCEGLENCVNCPQDCDTGGPCDDGRCQPERGENCSNSGDCSCDGQHICEGGVCRGFCGNGRCEENESCNTCQEDCGVCDPRCGQCFGGLRRCLEECPGECVRRVTCGESGYKCAC